MTKDIEVYEREAHEVELFRRIPEVEGPGKATPLIEISVKIFCLGTKTPEEIGDRMSEVAKAALSHPAPQPNHSQESLHYGPSGGLRPLPEHGKGGTDGGMDGTERHSRFAKKRSDREQMGSPYPH